MLSPIAAARCLAEIGICFMFAPAFHPATKRVADIRRQLGFRTAFNLLGPLTNPAQPPCQLIGVFSEDALEKCAQTLAQLGIGCAWVVWGSDGLDEITLTGVTKVAAVVGHDITRKELQPADFGLETLALEELRGGDAAENARILREILQGERRDGLRQIVLANAAAALYLGKRAATLPQAVKLAAEAIDCGQALAKLNALIAFSQAVES
jgi:anthranilate phosphoribosyltransferase